MMTEGLATHQNASGLEQEIIELIENATARCHPDHYGGDLAHDLLLREPMCN